MTNEASKGIEENVLDFILLVLATYPQFLDPIESFIASKRVANSSDVDFLYEINKCLIASSRSQLRQDLFVLNELGFKRGGYFVEFGATNGREMSNSYLLEKTYGWSGILAEAAKLWHKDLYKNRSCHIETKCVWSSTGQSLSFNEVNYAELSTIDSYSNSDAHSETRKHGNTYSVTTISLDDLLKKYNAPLDIDYLSIDTEGSEFEILNSFDFNKYNIKIITCEHNYTPMREKIYELLTGFGYMRKFEKLSQFDDWYVKT